MSAKDAIEMLERAENYKAGDGLAAAVALAYATQSAVIKRALSILSLIESGEAKVLRREPTREMWAASGDEIVRLRIPGTDHGVGMHHDIVSETVYRAMFDAASPEGGA